MATFPTATTGDLISAADWNSLQTHVYDAVDFAIESTNTDTALTGLFQNVIARTYTPPADWNTYTLKAVATAYITGSVSGDSFDLVARIGGVGGAVFPVTSNGIAMGGVSAGKLTTGISGAVQADLQIRNNTASRGTVQMATIDLVAKRDT